MHLSRLSIALWLPRLQCCCLDFWPTSPSFCFSFTSVNWIKFASLPVNANNFSFCNFLFFFKSFLAMDAAKFFPPENTTSAFYKFSIVRENSAQRQKQAKNKKKNKREMLEVVEEKIRKKRKWQLRSISARLLLHFHGFLGSLATPFCPRGSNRWHFDSWQSL